MLIERRPLPPLVMRQKPPRGSLINWDDPLTKGLRFFMPINERGPAIGGSGSANNGTRFYDTVGRAFARANNATTITMSRIFDLGPAINLTGAATSFLDFTPTMPPLMGFGAPLTVMVKFRTVAAAPGAQTPLIAKEKLTSTVNGEWGLFRPNGANTLEFEWFDGVGFNAAISTVAINTGAWFVAFATQDALRPVSLRLFNTNGRLLENVIGATPTILMGGPDHPVRIGSWTNSTTNVFTGDIECLGAWNLALETAACAELAVRPYTFLTPPMARTRFFFPKPAGGAAAFDPAFMAAMNRPWPDLIHTKPKIAVSGQTPSEHVPT